MTDILKGILKCHTEDFCIANPLLLPLTFFFGKHVESSSCPHFSHHVLASDFLEEGSLFWSDWTLKEQTLYMSLFVFDTESRVDEGGGAFVRAPSTDLDSISMQIWRLIVEEAAFVLRGQARPA